MTNFDLPNYSDISNKINSFIYNTPILTSSLIDEIVGQKVLFKCENLQKTGSFKYRGAVNAILNLSDEQKRSGVVTHSSGNFAQALALAAKNIGIKAYIIMPNSAPKVKIDAVKAYDGEVVICNSTLLDRESTANNVVLSTGATFIHPSNNIDVIIGQGSATKELLDSYPSIDSIFIPVGGGGLISGGILAAQSIDHKCLIIGAEPKNVDDAYRSLKSGKIETNLTTNTIADGLKTQLGDITFPILKNGVEKIIRVSESEIRDAMKLIWSRLKQVVEPSAAVGLAALIKDKSVLKDKSIGIILSGGNIDFENFCFTNP